MSIEISDGAVYVDVWIVGRDRFPGRSQGGLTDIDGYVPAQRSRPLQRRQQQPGLFRRRRAELHQRVGMGPRGYFIGSRDQDLALASCGVILRQASDFFEQLATTRVVKLLGRQAFRS